MKITAPNTIAGGADAVKAAVVTFTVEVSQRIVHVCRHAAHLHSLLAAMVIDMKVAAPNFTVTAADDVSGCLKIAKAIPPPNNSETPATSSKRAIFMHRIHHLLRFVVRVWELIQVELHGRLSVLKVCENFSPRPVIRALWRSACCLLFPLPCILVLAMLEMIPLESPTAGTKANYAFWIRHVMTLVLLAPGAMSNFRFFLPEMNITRLPSLTIGSFGAILSGGSAFIVALDRMSRPVHVTCQCTGVARSSHSSNGVYLPPSYAARIAVQVYPLLAYRRLARTDCGNISHLHLRIPSPRSVRSSALCRSSTYPQNHLQERHQLSDDKLRQRESRHDHLQRGGVQCNVHVGCAANHSEAEHYACSHGGGYCPS